MARVVDEGQFRVMTMDNIKSFHVMYVLHTYIVIHIFWFLFSLVLFPSVGFVAMRLCSQCDQSFQPSLSL